MSPGHFRLPGHSGTDFKHRKAFERGKELQQQKIPSRSASSTPPKVPYQSAYSGSVKLQWVLQTIAVLITFGALLCISYVLISNYYAAPPFTASSWELEHSRLKKENQRAYEMLVDRGDTFLASGELERAHGAFAQALQIDQYGKNARRGLTKTLALRCQTEGTHCAAANENLDFLLKMQYATEAELDYFVPTVTAP